jgi:hypothetical protein
MLKPVSDENWNGVPLEECQTSTVDLFARLELLVQRQSFCQCISHLGIVVDDENPMPVRHRSGPRRRSREGSPL